MEHLDHPSTPFQWCQNGAFLLLHAFIIALGWGAGLLVIFILSKIIELTSHWNDLLYNGNTITNAITCDKCHNLREISSVESDDCARWQKTNTSCHLRLKVIPKMCKKLRRFGNSHYQPLSPPLKIGARKSRVFPMSAHFTTRLIGSPQMLNSNKNNSLLQSQFSVAPAKIAWPLQSQFSFPLRNIPSRHIYRLLLT